ncbi:hypothetical protein [Paraburkholderia bonniea]|uniref:hypothetical protein n=1 Tax=Paraburkholderia bonniea TaxID=2152891 RepID=UPI0012922BE7|nr:hypothetical protein [Paraburkholderia bonniea]
MTRELNALEISRVSGAGLTGELVGGVGGYIIGGAYGVEAGALAGAAIGSVIPGIGTVGGAIIGGALGMEYGALAGSIAGAHIVGGIQDHGISFLFPNGIPRGISFNDMLKLSDTIDSYR